ncbi:MAG: LTA synthase family protein, partial [Bacteroidia bacterium]|nr:LTA synthase family protein [Bacteroidia bacterium]
RQEADSLFNSLKPSKDTTISIFNVSKPNIVVIMLESWTASAINSISGINNLTPGFDALVNEGLLFDSTYSSGNRTEKGLVAILSGFPAQPVTSIITEPDKTARLPALSSDLKKAGYSTAFIYGGESEFANMKSYLLMKDIETILDKNNFKTDQLNSKWGAHDGFLFDKSIEWFSNARQPFFATVMTLSSHEPYEVPMETKFKGNDETSLFKNSLNYSDLCLAEFFRKAKQQPWYKNTVFVLVADHGHEIGVNDIHFFDPVNFRIPLMIIGGALKSEFAGKRIHKIASQTDIASTLLNQLGLSSAPYKFSQNLMNPYRVPYAHFQYSDGLGFTQASNELLFDNPSGGCFYRKKNVEADSAATLRLARAYQQVIMQEYLGK